MRLSIVSPYLYYYKQFALGFKMFPAVFVLFWYMVRIKFSCKNPFDCKALYVQIHVHLQSTAPILGVPGILVIHFESTAYKQVIASIEKFQISYIWQNRVLRAPYSKIKTLLPFSTLKLFGGLI